MANEILPLLQEIEARAEKATPGPVEYVPGNEFDDWELISRANGDAVWIKQDDSGVPIPHADGEFIAAAYSDIPRLVAALKCAVEELEGWCHCGSKDLKFACSSHETLAEIEKILKGEK